MATRSHASRLLGILSAASLLSLTATQVAAVDLDQRVEFQIPPGKLSGALIHFSKQAQVQVLTSGEQTAEVTTRGVSGTHTLRGALHQLLENSGLEFKVMSDNAIAVSAGGSHTTSQRPVAEGHEALRLAQVDDTSPATRQATSELVSADSRGEGGLEEIVVTATKRSTKLQDVPFSIQAVSEETLSRMGAGGIADYARSVAGLSFVEMGHSGAKLTMRGLSTTQLNETQDTVGMYIDEVPVISAGGAAAAFVSSYDLKIFDIQRIEVLRGPQGTLFGAGSMGGTIRVITNAPDATRFDAAFETDLSSTDHGSSSYDVKAMVNVPLIDDELTARAVVYYNDGGGYIDNRLRDTDDVNDQQTRGGRVALAFTPNDRATITLKAAMQNRDSGGWSVETIGAGNLVQTRGAQENFSEESEQYNLVLNYDFGGAQLVSTSSYFDRKFHVPFDISGDFGPLLPAGEFGQQNSNTNSKDFVQEVRLASTSTESLQWLVGAVYIDQGRLFTQHISHIEGLSNPLYDSSQDATFEEFAGFGELSYRFTDTLTGTVGARSYHDEIDYVSESSGFFSNGLTSAGHGTDSGVTPKINLSFKPSEGLHVYGNVAKGYRRGDTNVSVPAGLCGADLIARGFTNGAPPIFNSDSLWNYEVGFKSEAADRSLSFSGDVYYVDWKDLPVPVILPCGFIFNINAGEARTVGSELEFAWRPFSGFELAGTYAYTNAELTKDEPSLGARRGDRAPGVPESNGSLAASYEFPIFARTSAFVRADVQYVGSSYNVYNRAVAGKMDAYTLGSLRLGIDRGPWQFAAYVKNITDERADLNLIQQQFGQLIVRNQPRTFGLTVRFNTH